MPQIVNTEDYSLFVDPTKNRIYCVLTRNDFLGDSTFFQNWEQAICLMLPGFTVLNDISRVRHVSEEWIEVSVKLQKRLIQAGLAGTAELLSETAADYLQISRINRPLETCSYAKEEIFTDKKIAEAWLDRISSS